jgi:3-(3-hydroxy-phenyl)propionate hydroxylase
MLLPGETGEKLRTQDGLRSLIGPVTPWLDVDRAQVVRSAVYRFHALVAERWSDGRIFLAGDAVHQTPPFYGQGMCHGIRDVHNLIWKLAHVLRGRAGERILASYQSEREPHVRTVIEAAVENGRYICTLDPVVAARRDIEFRERMRAGLDVGSFRKVIPALSDGLLDDPGAEPVGQLFPQPEPGLDSALGAGFAIVASNPLPASVELDWFTSTLHGKIVDRPAATVGDWLTATGCEAALVRPDRYIFGVARSAQDCAGLLARLRALTSAPESLPTASA